MALSKEAILSAKSPAREIHVPEWGGSVLVKCLSGTEREAWERWLNEAQSQQGTKFVLYGRAGLLVRCLVDESGARLFSDDDMAVLSNADGSGPALDRLFDAAIEINRIGKHEIDELAKN